MPKRSIGPLTDTGPILFGSVRTDLDRNPQDPTAAELGSSDQQQQQQEVTSPFVSITKELESPINQLADVFGQFVGKLESVSDINAKLAQFNESFGAFLYGLKMNAENVEWTEVKKTTKNLVWSDT